MFASPRITRSAFACCAFFIAACAKKENAAVDTSSVVASTTESTTNTAPTPINLADIAGKWNMRSVPSSGRDTTPTNYVLTATNSTTGWTITLPGRKPMAIQVVAEGDSVVTTSPEYASVRRKGVQVSTNGVLRLQNGDLVGQTMAHYRVKTADSVMLMYTSGTRTK
ncbi:MAG TPA: hypothetical protein VJ865_03940 [Gemmatimonadaceae bacterium]|nr:hypothetical protein [Gemmatimonadaceae bacterium]